LAACLDSLAHLDYPRDHVEVIVVDDGSDTLMGPVNDGFRDRLRLKLVRQPRSGPAAARNRGAARAQGEFLAFTDDDCRPAFNWLETLAQRFDKRPELGVGGKIINELKSNSYSQTTQTLLDYLCTYYNTDPNRALFLTSNNLAVPAAGFRDMGGFDPSFHGTGEDRDFCNRWVRFGYPMTYASEVIVYHVHDLTFSSFIRQHYNYGRGSFQFHQASIRHTDAEAGVEPVSFYFKLLLYPFFQRSLHRKGLLASLLVITQVVNAVGFLKEKKFRRHAL
jgi:GT2 family glycosyltransferase